MEFVKVSGLVLRQTPIKEADKIMTVLTAEHGRITVSGKGIRSLRSKHMTATQLFSYSDFTLSKKGDFYFLRESELLESFYDIRLDLEALSLATYVCDVAADLALENTDETDLLRLTLNTLYALSKALRPHKQIKAAFELRAAALSGFLPDLSACDHCGKEAAGEMYIDIMNGHLVCAACRSRLIAGVAPGEEIPSPDGTRILLHPIKTDVLAAMRHVTGARAEKMLAFSLDEESAAAFSAITERYLLNHLEHGFSSLDYYKSLLV